MTKAIRVKLTLKANSSINIIDQAIDDSIDIASYIQQASQVIRTQEWLEITNKEQAVAYRCSEIAHYEITVVNK